MKATNANLLIVWFSTVTIFFTTGILIGYYGITNPSQDSYVIDIKSFLLDQVSADEIDLNLRKLTSVPHVAGTVRDKEQAEWVRDRFIQAGLEAKTIPYEVLLSYPPTDGTVNQISIIDDQGGVQFETVGKQPSMGSPEEYSEEILANFNAYSAPGVVEGDIVYAFYGREEDFQYLQSRGINVSGHIALIRYGSIFRGSKVRIAQRFGVIGIVFFNDPREKAREGRNFTFPQSWWMPGLGVESGTLFDLEGDPLTPFYPAIESAYRIKESDQPLLPKIPVQPIGYDEAEIFLRHMSPENSPPEDWVGNLNASYSLGPGFINPRWKVKMNVSTSNQKRLTYNTIGILHGSIEDDRYILIGNHRDSWSFGALDPSSGTASMLEVVRSLGKVMKQKKWRPRRTMVFCSWGAEEYGLIGSYEFTEQYGKALSQRAVAYLNVDIAVAGNNILYGSASPTLAQLLIDLSKLVENPNTNEIAAGRTTVFDTWLKTHPDNRDNPFQPKVGGLGGTSDFKSFINVLGIPGTNFGYVAPYGYPTYHTLYDNYFLASEIVDKGFFHHQAVARLLAVVAVELADAVILPFDMRNYANYLDKSLSNLELKYGARLEENNSTFKYFRASVDYFSAAADKFMDSLKEVETSSNLMTIRKTNDRIMNLERFFIDPNGLPDRPETKHVIFSTSSRNSYATDTFAGLVDLLEKVGKQPVSQDKKTWAKILQHLSVIAFLIGEAARSLNEDF